MQLTRAAVSGRSSRIISPRPMTPPCEWRDEESDQLLSLGFVTRLDPVPIEVKMQFQPFFASALDREFFWVSLV